MKERIKKLRKDLNMSQDTFAKKLSLTKNYISLVENGSRNLSEQSLKLLCSMFNVNEEWLRTGIGEQYIEKSKDEYITEMLADVLKSNDKNNFKYRFISALSKLDDKGWDGLEELLNLMSKDKEK